MSEASIHPEFRRRGRRWTVAVKAGATVTTSDFSGLRKLKEASGKRFKSGVVLCDAPIANTSYGLNVIVNT